MKPKALLFDMDGLMFDTERLSDVVWQEQALRFGIAMKPEDMALLRGRNRAGGKREFVKRFGPDVPYDVLYDTVFEDFSKRLEKHVPLRPGLMELLAAAQTRALPMAVVSSTPRALVARHLQVAKVEQYFTALVCGDMVQNSKPAPDIFLLGAKTLGTAPEDCFVLEDSYNGVRAGHAAGCYTIMVPDTEPPTDEMRALANRIFPSLLEAIPLLDGVE